MKLLINTATLFQGGGIQVANSFIEECKKYKEYEYHIILGLTLQQKIKPELFPANFSFYSIPYHPSKRLVSLKSPDSFFKKLENNIKPDVVFTTSGPAYWKPKAPHLVGYNLAHFICPDSPYFEKISFYQNFKWKLNGYFFKDRFIKEADAYVVQTEDVKKRLKSWLSTDKLIEVVSNTCSSYYWETPHNNLKLPPKRKEEVRLLLFSAYHDHKNIEIVPEIIKRMSESQKNSIRFVLTLKQNIYEKIFSKDIWKYVLNVGPVNPEEGPGLYEECDAVFLPTILECFTATYAEAMAMEKPIITSDLGFARSICKDSALYFNPYQPTDALNTIEQLIENNALKQSLVKNGKIRIKEFLSAEERAKKYLLLCSQLANKE